MASIVLITNYPLKPTIPGKGGEIGFDPFDTTCGGYLLGNVFGVSSLTGQAVG